MMDDHYDGAEEAMARQEDTARLEAEELAAQQPTQQLVPKAQLVANERGYIAPTTVEEAMRMARAVIAGRLAPDSYNNDESKVMLGIMAALEAGLPPLYGLRQIAIINGRPSIWGDAAMALIQNSGKLENQTVEWHVPQGFDPNSTEIAQWPVDYGVTVSLWRRGQIGPYVGTFTVGDAKRAKLWLNARKVPWIEHPRRMLKIRARAFPQRDGFADALAGLSIREEMEDTFGNEDKAVDGGFLSNDAAVEAPPIEEQEA